MSDPYTPSPAVEALARALSASNTIHLVGAGVQSVTPETQP